MNTKVKVRYSYLRQQFKNSNSLWKNLKEFVKTGDFTLGKPLMDFEKKFAKLIGSKFAIGVNSGTDAIKLSLVAAGIKKDDEIITSANTFVATVGAINEVGAIPVFVDCDDTFCINASMIQSKITKKTKAIIPVHFAGYVCDMKKIISIAKKNNLLVIEDACQSILGEFQNKKAGTWGLTGAFSLHPLKNLNVWSDGGLIVTSSSSIAKKIKLLRNHGLSDRDHVKVLGFNSRLDTFQAVVGNWLIPQTSIIAEKRIRNAKYLDKHLSKIKEITIPPRPKHMKIVYHLYIIFVMKRNLLLDFCLKNGIEAKVHYPVPIYRQEALKKFGYTKGNFKNTDSHAKKMISFPCDQHLSKTQLDYIIKIVKKFYSS